MNSVVHFEIPSTDLERAKAFYEAVFGWQMMQYDPENVMTTTTESDENGMPAAPGAINGSIYKASGKTPNVVVDVPNIEAHLEIVRQHGGQLVDEPVTMPRMGRYARFADPDGNLVGLWESL